MQQTCAIEVTSPGPGEIIEIINGILWRKLKAQTLTLARREASWNYTYTSSIYNICWFGKKDFDLRNESLINVKQKFPLILIEFTVCCSPSPPTSANAITGSRAALRTWNLLQCRQGWASWTRAHGSPQAWEIGHFVPSRHCSKNALSAAGTCFH